MTFYLLLKCLHILTATVLFGTGIGIAFFKWITDRSGDVRAIRVICERVVLADFLFTTPAVILQPLTGLGLAYLAGYSVSNAWLLLSMMLFLAAGACWLPVVWLQIRMREIARHADTHNQPLPLDYWRYAKVWLWLGIPAFTALIGIYWLMVAKPTMHLF